MTTAPGTERAPRRGFRLGQVSLIASIVGPVWLIAAVYMGFESSAHDFPGGVQPETDGWDVARYIFIMAAFVVVPGSLIVTVVFAIAAFLRNLRTGVVMGAIGLGLLVLSALGLLALFFVAFGVLPFG